MESWRGRLAVFASRGETSGPRVDEAREHLNAWKARNFLVRECGYDAATADSMIDASKAPGEAR
jgi:hypothetical protein